MVKKIVEPSKSVVPEVAKEQILSDSTVQTLSEKPLIEEVPLEKKNKKLFILGSVIFAFIILSSALIFYFVNRVKPKKIINTKVVPVKKTTEQEVVQLKRSEITLEILNGSGVAGLAGKTAKIFEDKGYLIVKTGNTEDVTGNKLLVNDLLKDKINTLLEDLKKELNIASISGSLTDSTASARIILGK
ncbi:MAG: Cell envelope-related transcriptional attenuator [Candidatus Roizmanbacteria bacterium GW2011_GWC2_35_12]|uniref:Cell envelope-related transcriptional attenuator n=1 Tax=Candidatus Roizmanbacteria bacterium GW2011_GWC2_35_12 TaxID=1618485 RepID=A0A0G0DY05_9BACT|nr:MAG: Cell envelope-related transcriptional attenuator [Candidatus Roizmanbacteria bacterium GW2011_GWC2_35_12]